MIINIVATSHSHRFERSRIQQNVNKLGDAKGSLIYDAIFYIQKLAPFLVFSQPPGLPMFSRDVGPAILAGLAVFILPQNCPSSAIHPGYLVYSSPPELPVYQTVTVQMMHPRLNVIMIRRAYIGIL